VSILSTLLNWQCQYTIYTIHSINDCLMMGDARPYHHARAVQQRRHRLTACKSDWWTLRTFMVTM